MRVIPPRALTLTASNVAASGEAAYSAGTTYADGARVAYTTGGIEREYESLQGSNTGNPPDASPAWWLDLGASNRFAMLDDRTSSQTENAGSIEATLTPDGRCDTLALFGLVGESVRVVVKSGATTLKDETFDLLDTDVSDWYEYYFADLEYRSALSISLPGLYANLTVELTISASETAKCGHIVLGMGYELGCSKRGISRGIVDYSRKDTDDFGETYLLQRTYSQTLDIPLKVERDRIDAVVKKLESLRAVPCVWNGNNDGMDDEALIVYGFYTDWSTDIVYSTQVDGTIEIQGLT